MSLDVDCNACPIDQCGEEETLSYAQKRRADNRERVRRFRARKASREASLEASVLTEVEEAVIRDRNPCSRTIQRISADLSKNLANYAASLLKGYDQSIQHLSLEKFLGQQVLGAMVPDFLKNPSEVKMRHSVLTNFREGITDHLVGVRPSNVVMAKDIVCTFAASANLRSTRSVASVLGVDRRNIKRAMHRRVLLDTKQDAFWLRYRSGGRTDSLTETVKEIVRRWWFSETTVSPNRKDIVRHRIGVKNYDEHPTHYLQVSEVLHYTTYFFHFSVQKNS